MSLEWIVIPSMISNSLSSLSIFRIDFIYVQANESTCEWCDIFTQDNHSGHQFTNNSPINIVCWKHSNSIAFWKWKTISEHCEIGTHSKRWRQSPAWPQSNADIITGAFMVVIIYFIFFFLEKRIAWCGGYRVDADFSITIVIIIYHCIHILALAMLVHMGSRMWLYHTLN